MKRHQEKRLRSNDLSHPESRSVDRRGEQNRRLRSRKCFKTIMESDRFPLQQILAWTTTVATLRPLIRDLYLVAPTVAASGTTSGRRLVSTSGADSINSLT